MRYLPHTPADIAKMLDVIGETSVDELFNQIPAELRLNGSLNLPTALSEPELMAHLKTLSKNADQCSEAPMFLGAGLYPHHVSPTVDQLLLRSELYTAYTPYQPEVSQGTLQSIFEFQTLIARIFDMEYANASMYDGASAAAEAVLMARRLGKKRRRIVVSNGIHPEYIETIRTYLNAMDDGEAMMDLVPLDDVTGTTDTTALAAQLGDDVAAVVVGYPNFFGVIEDLTPIAEASHSAGALLISVTMDPFSLGTITPPGALNVDIAVGEGQPISVPISFGGPGLGLFSVKADKKFLRQMPGRLVGKTTDTNSETGFVLTLSTREQHIRREKATSNICTNHGLCALAATIQLSLLGKQGFRQVSNLCFSKAAYLKQRIDALPGLSIKYTVPTFDEFAVKVEGKTAAEVLAQMPIQAGVDLGRFSSEMTDTFLVAVTEIHSKAQLENYVTSLASICK